MTNAWVVGTTCVGWKATACWKRCRPQNRWAFTPVSLTIRRDDMASETRPCQSLATAPADPTEARKPTVRRVGRSDRRAQRHPGLLRSIRPKRATATEVFEAGPIG